MNDSFKTLLAFIGGVAAGAAIGILLAPEKGVETRRKLLERAKDMSDGLTDAAKEKYDEFLEWKDTMIDGAEETVKSTVNSGMHNASQGFNKVENKVKNAQL